MIDSHAPRQVALGSTRLPQASAHCNAMFKRAFS
jgi:hypothetical protein